MSRRYPLIVLLVFLVFFVISFLTNILGPLVPDIIEGFDLSLGLAGFLPFAFFVAYGVMSIPAGMLLERYREKRVMVAAFALAFAGSLLFASTPTFAVALPSLFLIGIGMTMLQVAINPLLRAAGGEEHFAFLSVLGQLVFGSASFLSPLVYSYLVTQPEGRCRRARPLVALLARQVPRELPWVSLYWLFAAVTLLMVVLLAAVRLPRFELKEDERAGAWADPSRAARRPHRVALLRRHLLLRRLRAGHRQLDLEVPRHLPRLRPAGRGRARGGVVLGPDDRRLPARPAAAQALRLAARADRLRRWRPSRTLAAALLGAGAGLLLRLHAARLLPLGDVVGDLLAGAQLGAAPPRLVLGHPLHRHRRRRRSSRWRWAGWATASACAPAWACSSSPSATSSASASGPGRWWPTPRCRCASCCVRAGRPRWRPPSRG